MLPQPPPDAPAPPPSEAALLSRRKLKWLWIVGMLSIVTPVVLPLFIRAKPRGGQTEVMSNARQVGLAMIEFQEEYGKCPDYSTIAAVETATGKVVPSGTTSSNGFFRQLYVAGIVSSEAVFYAKNRDTHRPDGNVDGRHFLEKGECGFTYFLGATKDTNPGRPLVVAPMIHGTDRFDPKPFKGKAIILKMDSSVSELTIDEDGHALLQGRNMMDPHHPIWDGHPPAIAWPDL